MDFVHTSTQEKNDENKAEILRQWDEQIAPQGRPRFEPGQQVILSLRFCSPTGQAYRTPVRCVVRPNPTENNELVLVLDPAIEHAFLVPMDGAETTQIRWDDDLVSVPYIEPKITHLFDNTDPNLSPYFQCEVVM